jgi:hypothetical protein
MEKISVPTLEVIFAGNFLHFFQTITQGVDMNVLLLGRVLEAVGYKSAAKCVEQA